MANSERLRIRTSCVASTSILLRLSLAASFVLGAMVVETNGAGASTGCKSTGYTCTIDGYNATTMNNSWAAKYYGSDTKGGIGTPPHNCTLFAAWMLAHNGLADPGQAWGYADQWGVTLASDTNQIPAVGSIAWYDGPGMGHVAYVARVNWANHMVFLVSDNYASNSAGYTSNAWAPFTQPTGYIHLRDLSTRLSLTTRRLKLRFLAHFAR
ncbi:MAG TPA: CHAP domain-containing protein [Acidimicrobiales bacterium]|nr:CHAP domain-containing protein [Acidimicrobiales bacterium]